MKIRKKAVAPKLSILLAFLFLSHLSGEILAGSLDYFRTLILLDYFLLFIILWVDNERNTKIEMGGLVVLSIISHYLTMQDYVNRTPATQWFFENYLWIQPFLYHSFVGVLAFWGLQQIYAHYRQKIYGPI